MVKRVNLETSVLLQKYGDQIQSLNKEREDVLERRTVELFFSFDIVNSSAYKVLNYSGWSNVILKLLKSIQKKVVSKISSAKLWRVLGDEVIFLVPIREKQDIFDYINIIFEILNTFVSELKNGEFFDNLDIKPKEQQLMKMQNIVSLKAAAWIAIVGENINEMEQYDNLMQLFKPQENYGFLEFLGNDIDAGFRIKNNSQDRRLVISYELAYILSRNTDYLRNIFIVTYKQLKGIWHDRLYPIIWYYNKDMCNGISFEQSFFYDEEESNDLTKAYFNNKVNPVLEALMYSDVDYALKKILSDQKLEDKLLKIDNIIKESQNDEKGLLNTDFLLELHCVAVCYDENSKKILIMKRASSKPKHKYPDCWEFGCAKALSEKTLVERLKSEYKKDFGIDIEIQCNNSRDDKQPIPIAMYEVSNNKGKDKGIITFAQIIGNVDLEKINPDKHSEMRWITENEIDDFKEQTVPDFKNTLKLVFKKINEDKIND